MRGGGECFYDEERREKWSNIAAFCVRNRNEYIITGIGTTHIRRVHATVVGLGTTTGGTYTTSNYMGDYSWGRIDLTGRAQSYTYNFYGEDGTGGISTSGLVRRTNPLKFTNYIV